MQLSLHWTTILVDEQNVELYIPDAQDVLSYYQHNKEEAYWTKLWPASLGLCSFLNEHSHLVNDKTILELAAGTGLPGIYIAPLVKQVTITDKSPLATDCVQQSVNRLQLQNVQCITMNWLDAPQHTLPDLVMLSDVNYDPESFEGLKTTIHHYLNNHIPVIISTPQRLVAKSFISQFLPYCHIQWHKTIQQEDAETEVSVFVLV